MQILDRELIKLADLEDNMDWTRLDELTGSDLKRFKKYHKAWQYLKARLQKDGES